MPQYASIALPLPLLKLFTYSVPSDMAQSAEVGRRALVPFGARLLTGFIVDLPDSPGDVFEIAFIVFIHNLKISTVFSG